MESSLPRGLSALANPQHHEEHLTDHASSDERESHSREVWVTSLGQDESRESSHEQATCRYLEFVLAARRGQAGQWSSLVGVRTRPTLTPGGSVRAAPVEPVDHACNVLGGHSLLVVMGELGGRNQATLSEFVSQHGRRLMLTAVLMTGDREAGQDLCQETLARLVTAWPRVRSVDAAPAYAVKVMTRLYHRRQGRRWRAEIPYESVPDELETEPDAAAAIDVRLALSHLPSRQRATLILRYYADLSIAETASALGCSEGTVKSQSSRGLTSLAKLVDDTESTRSRE